MSPNAFTGRSKAPGDAELAEAMGPAKILWDRLLKHLTDEHHLAIREWNSYSPKAGWSLRLKQKDRNILYLVPCKGAFCAAFVLGDKAVAAAHRSKLPQYVITMINEAKKYAEGTAVRFETVRARDIEPIVKLAGIKLAS